MPREDLSVKAIVELLPPTGEVTFQAWQDTISQNRKRGASWLKAKHANMINIRTVLNEDGTITLYVSRV